MIYVKQYKLNLKWLPSFIWSHAIIYILLKLLVCYSRTMISDSEHC